jgi:SHS2 domain-containing protein
VGRSSEPALERSPPKIDNVYEFFEHTADLGLRIRAADLNTLMAEAAAALFAAIVEDPAAIEPRQRAELRIDGTEPEYLLFDWLRELLFRFDTEHLVLGRFEVKVDATGLSAVVWGEPFDARRHALAHEVKAITYHGLRVEQQSDGWLAEVIVDI